MAAPQFNVIKGALKGDAMLSTAEKWSLRVLSALIMVGAVMLLASGHAGWAILAVVLASGCPTLELIIVSTRRRRAAKSDGFRDD